MLKTINLSKIYYPKKGKPVTALDDVSLDIADKGLVFLLGKSGSGKSTLLNLLGGLDSYTSGDIIIKGKSTKNFKQSGFDSYRNTFIGFIFQEFNILEEYSVGQNIGMALELQHKKADKDAINNILKQVDLEDYFNRKPNELSGGQKQRVAIARALVKEPEIIMADEPTGALDSKTGKLLFETLKKISKNKLVIVVTHDRENAEIFGDRVIELADGKIIADRTRSVQNGKLYEQKITVLDSKLIKIKAGSVIDAQDLANINNLLLKNNKDAFLSLDNNDNSEFAKKSALLFGEQSFEPTTKIKIEIKDYKGNNLKLVKSRLPAKDSFKLGASSLNHKKLRLIFSIFLSLITFVVSGLATSASLFDKYKTEVHTLSQNKSGNFFVYGTSGEKFEDKIYYQDNYFSGFSKEKIKEIEQISGKKPLSLKIINQVSFFKDNVFNLNLNNNIDNAYYQLYYQNYVIIENENDAGIKKIGNSRLPLYDNEIAISDFTADTFINYSYKNSKGGKIAIKNPEDMIGKTLKLGKKDFFITGVYETETDKNDFEKFKNMNQYDPLAATFNPHYLLMGMCFVSPEFSFNTNDYPLNVYNLEKTGMVFSSLNNTETIINYEAEAVIKEEIADNCIVYNNEYINDSIFLSIDYAKSLIPEFAKNLNELGIVDYENLDAVINAWKDVPIEDKKIKVELIPRSEYLKDQKKEYFIEVAGLSQGKTKVAYGLFKRIKEDDYGIDVFTLSTKSIYKIGPLGHNEFDCLSAKTFTKMKGANEANIYWGKGNSARPLNDDEIIISLDFMSFSEFDSLENNNAVWGRYIFGGFDYKKEGTVNKVFGDKNLKIVGVYNSAYTIVSDNFFDYLKDFNLRPNGLVVRLTNDTKQNRNIIESVNTKLVDNYAYVEDIIIKSQVSDLLDSLNTWYDFIKKIILCLTLVFFIFSCLFLMNFIGSSVAYKKKEIGVLRAIGARGIDVFKIFFSEGLIIGFITFILSSISLFVLSGIINYKLGFDVLMFNLIPYLLMAALGLLVILIATYVPIKKVTAKKPIDAINNR